MFTQIMFLTVNWMVLSILTRKGCVTSQNKNRWRSIWMLALKVLKNSPRVNSSKYALVRALLGELRLKLRVHLATKGRICNEPSELCLETDRVKLQLLISIQRLFQIEGSDICTRQHSISNHRMCLSRPRSVLNGIDDGSKLLCNAAITIAYCMIHLTT